MPDITDNYRMILQTKSRVISNRPDRTVYDHYEDVAKVEYRDGREEYFNNFTDYHKNK